MISFASMKPWAKRYRRCALLGLLFLAGCSGTPDKHLSPDFGHAYADAFAAQVVNPAAPAEPQAITPLPGEIADLIYQKRYIQQMTEETEDDNADNRRRNINTFR